MALFSWSWQPQSNKMMREKFENILLIAGTGQNVGKTTLVCQILKSEKAKKPVAVKITPHFHKTTPGLIELEKGENWILFEETDTTSGKDTSLYLQNGAVKSYLILAYDEALGIAFSAIKKFLPFNIPVVIESAALINFIVPGLFLMVSREGFQLKEESKTLFNKADLSILSDGKNFTPTIGKIAFEDGWILR